MGAAYSVVDEVEFSHHTQCILVENVLTTLQALAAFHRLQFQIPVIGITGTNGKTTTKELLHAVLSTQFQTVATKGNLNNHIGVPLTLLNITSETEIAIIEMGANHPGEIAELCDIAKPNFGIVTNIGKAHLEGFGSIENIIETKTALYRAVKAVNGKIFVNASDEVLMKQAAENDLITYGDKVGIDCYGKPIEANPFVKIAWGKDLENEIQTQISGIYNFQNFMAAISIGIEFGIKADQIKQALSSYDPSLNRSQIVKTEKNTLLLDAYNANPSSMRVAIDNFMHISAENKVMILGDMMELGNESSAEHEGIYHAVIDSGILPVYFIGETFSKYGSQQAGMMCFTDSKAAHAWFEKNPIENAFVLIKGSRAMKLETLTEVL